MILWNVRFGGRWESVWSFSLSFSSSLDDVRVALLSSAGACVLFEEPVNSLGRTGQVRWAV